MPSVRDKRAQTIAEVTNINEERLLIKENQGNVVAILIQTLWLTTIGDYM